jgi:hypothetical protein
LHTCQWHSRHGATQRAGREGRAPEANVNPLRYRVVHRARPWSDGEGPKLEREVVEGDVGLLA